jgi:hypothetical protein
METSAQSNDDKEDNWCEQAPLLQHEATNDEETSNESNQRRVEMTVAVSDSTESRGGNGYRINFTTFRRTRRSNMRWFGLAAVCLVMTGEYYA